MYILYIHIYAVLLWRFHTWPPLMESKWKPPCSIQMETMVGAVLICSKTKDDYSFNDKVESKVKGCCPSTEGQWKVCDSKFISSLCNNSHKPFLVLIWVWLNWCEECFTANFLPQTLSGFLVGVDEFYIGAGSKSCTFHVIVPDEIHWNIWRCRS